MLALCGQLCYTTTQLNIPVKHSESFRPGAEESLENPVESGAEGARCTADQLQH